MDHCWSLREPNVPVVDHLDLRTPSRLLPRRARRVWLTQKREASALASMGEGAVQEIERLIQRVERQGPTRPELAQLMVARVRCLREFDQARSRSAAQEFIGRLAEADDPALRMAAQTLQEALASDPSD